MKEDAGFPQNLAQRKMILFADVKCALKIEHLRASHGGHDEPSRLSSQAGDFFEEPGDTGIREHVRMLIRFRGVDAGIWQHEVKQPAYARRRIVDKHPMQDPRA